MARRRAESEDSEAVIEVEDNSSEQEQEESKKTDTSTKEEEQEESGKTDTLAKVEEKQPETTEVKPKKQRIRAVSRVKQVLSKMQDYTAAKPRLTTIKSNIKPVIA